MAKGEFLFAYADPAFPERLLQGLNELDVRDWSPSPGRLGRGDYGKLVASDEISVHVGQELSVIHQASPLRMELGKYGRVERG